MPLLEKEPKNKTAAQYGRGIGHTPPKKRHRRREGGASTVEKQAEEQEQEAKQTQDSLVDSVVKEECKHQDLHCNNNTQDLIKVYKDFNL